MNWEPFPVVLWLFPPDTWLFRLIPAELPRLRLPCPPTTESPKQIVPTGAFVSAGNRPHVTRLVQP